MTCYETFFEMRPLRKTGISEQVVAALVVFVSTISFSYLISRRNHSNNYSPHIPKNSTSTLENVFPSRLEPLLDIFDANRRLENDNIPVTSRQSGNRLGHRPVYKPLLGNSLPTLCAGDSVLNDYEYRHQDDELEVSQEELESGFEQLISRFLSPWIPLSDYEGANALQRPITLRLLDSMEVLIRGGAFRVRLAGDGTVRYRVVEHWGQTYRISRMKWTLELLQKAMVKYPELAKIKCEFYVNVADSPRSTVDSMSRDMGGIPVFSFRTSTSYLDVPVPDPVEYGSNGNYVWKTENKLPYDERIAKLVFRGSASCLHDYHDDNWLSVPRMRLAALSKERRDLIDAGITRWIKTKEGTTNEDLERSLGTGTVKSLDYEEQGKYQFILDVDGGLGSSRKRGILTSGSVPFFQKSNWYAWYEPLLKENVHYIPVETYLHDLVKKIESARDDVAQSKQMVKRAECFGKFVTGEDAAMLYWKMLLERYSLLQEEVADGDESVGISMCSLRPATAEGPMGCSDGWLTYNGTIPFGCRYTAAKKSSFKFECWRNIGRGVELKFTNDPVHSGYNDERE